MPNDQATAVVTTGLATSQSVISAQGLSKGVVSTSCMQSFMRACVAAAPAPRRLYCQSMHCMLSCVRVDNQPTARYATGTGCSSLTCSSIATSADGREHRGARQHDKALQALHAAAARLQACTCIVTRITNPRPSTSCMLTSTSIQTLLPRTAKTLAACVLCRSVCFHRCPLQVACSNYRWTSRENKEERKKHLTSMHATG